METILLKMARQLDSLDEASLMNLWNKYAGTVASFEPTKRWEEAALVFAMIQGKRWKNQLFNYHWACQTRAARDSAPMQQGQGAKTDFSLEIPHPQAQKEEKKPCTILQFRKPGKSE